MIIAPFLAIASLAVSAPEPDLAPAREALQSLARRVPRFHTVAIQSAGSLVLKAEDGLSVEDLRGVTLDDAPPALSGPPPKCDPRQADDCPAEARPYVARGIAPFRFRHFQCEFNYGGWHNWQMQDYAATHGFNIIFPYARKAADVRHWPAGTKILSWGGFVHWPDWMKKHGIDEGRYDRLAGMDLVAMHLKEDLFRREPTAKEDRPRADLLMIDMEHSVLAPEKLREQAWYPRAASEAERKTFEKRYYDGYGATYLSSVQAARRQGWETISIYGWYPYGRTWGGLEKVHAEPGTDFAWNAFGRRILEAVDIVNNSVYCFYWSPQNVAYTLANVDMNMKMVRSADPKKPVRPYYWTLLHGGGGGWRWWQGQPLSNEDERAMTAMAFFTGVDGFDTWNWSGTGSHHTVALRTKTRDGWQYHDVMVGRPLEVRSEAGHSESLRRHDVLHVVAVDEPPGTVRFQKIVPRAKNAGTGPGFPTFSVPVRELLPNLRPQSEPVAAMIEGMALVQPLEYLLRHGSVKIDMSAQEQFARTLPIVRRVKLGRWHVLASYDPQVVHGGTPRPIVLENFDGRAGRTLQIPADEQVRVFVLEE